MLRTQLRACVAAIAAAAIAVTACSAERLVVDAGRTAPGTDPIEAPYGALEPRIVALDALAGRRAPVMLRMERVTIEGARIVYLLSVQQGAALLSADLREDGGGVRTEAITALQLVRYVPSRWQGNVEVTKEHFVAVQPAVARATPGTYLLVHPRCLTAPCSEVF
jgi:hypothetical protein